VVTLPYWPGLGLGFYPSVETIGAQLAGASFVIGSYFLAQEMKVKGPKRRRLRSKAEAPAPQPEPERELVQ
jgi:high-affinity iron transporter